MSWGFRLSALWLVYLVAVAAVGRPRPVRVLGPGPAVVSRAAIRHWVGAAVRRVARRPEDRLANVRVGTAVLAGLPVAAVEPIAGLVVGVAAAGAPMLSARRDRLRRVEAVRSELPEVIDLLRLSLGAGGSVLAGIRSVPVLGDGPVVAALSMACLRCERGLRLCQALDGVVEATSDEVRPLVRALARSEHYGTELTGTLERLALEARATRRRRAEMRARKVPVRLLLPLVVCILPAFVLLTLVPTLAGTFDNLRLT